jgi:hypothetical protein
MGDPINVAKHRQSIGQQPKRPVLPPGGWSRAGQREQVGFSFTIQLARSPTSGSMAMRGCVQPLFDEALADTMNGLATDIEGLLDILISPSRTPWTAISFEQDLGMGTHAACSSAGVDQLAKLSALISSQGYNVFSVSVSGHWVGYLQ